MKGARVTQLKAIDTYYNGYRFRSRLEARWAVFFDALGIRYEYEKEGFDLGDAGYYLPDFWLPDLRYWVEIKGEKPTDGELSKAKRLSAVSRDLVFVCYGALVTPSEETLPPRAVMALDAHVSWDVYWQLCPICRTFSIGHLVGGGAWYCLVCDCGEHRDEWLTFGTWAGYTFSKGDWIAAQPIAVERAPQLMAAYAAAQQARFEHGEAPKLPTR